MPREVREWIGKRPESMPSTKVLLRLHDKQDGKCACGCGQPLDLERPNSIDCDHIVPLKDGGENRESNLQLLLKDCHADKTKAENSARATAERHQAKAFTTTKERKPSGFRTPEPQRTATRAIRKFSPIDGVFEVEQ